MIGRRCVAAAVLTAGLFLATGVAAFSAEGEKAPAETGRVVLYPGSPGRFEIITVQPELGPWAVELSEAVWRHLHDVLVLPPSGFRSPVTVRLIPGERWNDTQTSRVWVETAGRVAVQVPADTREDEDVVMRAMVRGLLARRGAHNVEFGSADPVPLWLELAAWQWVRARLQPALHDQWRQEAAEGRLPPLLAVLSWRRDRPLPPTLSTASYGVLLWLQALGKDNGQWTEFLRRQLAGAPAAESLGAFRGQPWETAGDVELAWQVGFHDLRRQRTMPLLSIEESRELVIDWSRVVLRDERLAADVLVSPEELWERRKELVVRVVAETRTAAMELRLRTMHPFYVNAGNSLGRYFHLVKTGGSRSDWAGAWEQFEADWRDAEELAAVSAAALDRAELAASGAR